MREKYKNKKISKKQLQSKGFKVNVAILGGGDIVFPIITAGVMLKTFGFNAVHLFGTIFLLPLSSLFVTFGATLGLAYLLLFSEKKKFYPAMPFITAGILLGMILSWIIF
jgi:presenilin-like A22 family membrane protease